MLAALLVLAPTICTRCENPKPITWERAMELGLQRTKETNKADLRKLISKEGGGVPSRHARNPSLPLTGWDNSSILRGSLLELRKPIAALVR